MEQRKDYLSWENARNRRAHKLFQDILHEAFGSDEEVVIAHHLTFDGAGDDPDEIPSADTMIFDHDIARVIWGEANYIGVLLQLAATPCDQRDALLGELYYGRAKAVGA